MNARLEFLDYDAVEFCNKLSICVGFRVVRQLRSLKTRVAAVSLFLPQFI